MIMSFGRGSVSCPDGSATLLSQDTPTTRYAQSFVFFLNRGERMAYLSGIHVD